MPAHVRLVQIDPQVLSTDSRATRSAAGLLYHPARRSPGDSPAPAFGPGTLSAFPQPRSCRSFRFIRAARLSARHPGERVLI